MLSRRREQSVRKPKLGEIVAQQMIKEIIDRRWPTGEVIGTERDLIAKFKISRATFREAIRQVERHGIARMRRGVGGGLVVSDPPRRTTERALSTYLEVTDVTMREQTEVRLILDAMAARLAADRIQPAEIERLRNLSALPQSDAPGFLQNAQSMLDVRLTIASASGNPALPLFMQALNGALLGKLQTIEGAASQFEGDQTRTHEENRALVEAIVGGDPARAELIIMKDFEQRDDSVRRLDEMLSASTRRDDETKSWRETEASTGAPRKASEVTALRIADDVRAHDWKVGTPLGPEAALQERYGVSRAVLREAVRLLEMHHVVRMKSGMQGGLVIDRPDPDYTVRCVVIYLEHLGMRGRHLWEVQSTLAFHAAELAARRATPEDVHEMEAILATMRSSDADMALAISGDLHILIAEKTKNRALALFLRVLVQLGLDTLPSIDSRTLPWLERTHRLLVEAIGRGDAGMARRRMIEVFDQSGKWVRAAPNY